MRRPEVSRSGKLWLVPDSLTYGGGVVTAVINGKTYQLTLPALTANIRYQLYLVPGGTLVLSTNENSAGPVGYSNWILVGSLWSSPSSTFDLFLDVDSTPNFVAGMETSLAQSIGGGVYVTRDYNGQLSYSARNATGDLINNRIYVPTAGIYDVGGSDYWSPTAWVSGDYYEMLVQTGHSDVRNSLARDHVKVNHSTYQFTLGSTSVWLPKGGWCAMQFITNKAATAMSVDPSFSWMKVTLSRADRFIKDL